MPYVENKESVCWVTMTDKFMSGWGLSNNKTNKLIFRCRNYQEAQIVYNNAVNRGDMNYVNIVCNKPYYNSKSYFVQDKTDDSTNWYIPNYFKGLNNARI